MLSGPALNNHHEPSVTSEPAMLGIVTELVVLNFQFDICATNVGLTTIWILVSKLLAIFVSIINVLLIVSLCPSSVTVCVTVLVSWFFPEKVYLSNIFLEELSVPKLYLYS